MKNILLNKEQIVWIRNLRTNENKHEIETLFPDVFEEEIALKNGFSKLKFEVGSWYISMDNHCLILYLGKNKVYGLFRPHQEMDEWNWANNKTNYVKKVNANLIKEYLEKHTK